MLFKFGQGGPIGIQVYYSYWVYEWKHYDNPKLVHFPENTFRNLAQFYGTIQPSANCGSPHHF